MALSISLVEPPASVPAVHEHWLYDGDESWKGPVLLTKFKGKKNLKQFELEWNVKS